MKTSKKLLSVILAMLMVASCASTAFAAQSFSGICNEDITISSGATIADDAVFNGKVTIASGAAVEKGTFNAAVINNGTINGGAFKSTVTNNSEGLNIGVQLSCGINGGTFSGAVTNSTGATIGGGTFNGSLINNGELIASVANVTGAVANCSVNNIGKISAGSYYNTVNNSGTVNSGAFYNVINNSGTVNSGVSAIIKNGNAYTVQGAPTIASKVTLSGKDATFNLPKGSVVTVIENGQLDLNCPCTINGTILLSRGAKLTSNGGSLTSGSNGTIRVPAGTSFSGTSASKFDYITYREHSIKVESNVEANQFDFAVSGSAYKDATVSYSFDLSGTIAGCLILNNITIYKGRKSDSNIIAMSTDRVNSFTMPDEDVIIYIDCVANHNEKTEHKDATCTADGYDRTYCDTCKNELSFKKIDALGHQFSGWVRNADPSSKMLKSRTCTRPGCGHVEKSYIEIKGYDNQNVTVDYKSTLTFNYNISAPDGCYVQWQLNGNSPVNANDNGFTVTEATDNFKIKAIVYGSGVDGIRDEYVVNVTVKHGFFDKIIAFFRGLFKALPVYIDNVKQ